MAKRAPLKLTLSTERGSAPPAAPHAASGGLLPAAAAPRADKTRALGIGLKESEIAALDSIAAATGFARNALCRRAIRDFIKAYERGEINLSELEDVPVPAKKRLRMD